MTRLLVATWLTLTALTAQAGPAFPGGVLDSTGRTAFVAADDGVDAVDLETGLSRWKSQHAAWPLLVAGDRLYGLAFARGAMTVVALDLAGKGERGFRSDPIELPAWADASSLRCTWSLEKRTLSLWWQARGALGRQAGGAAEVDLVLARVAKLDAAAPAPAAVPRLLEKLPLRWHKSISGQMHAVVEEEVGPMSLLRRRSQLVLYVWSETTGKQARSAKLLEGSRPMLMPGVDGLHVWVRDAGTFESAADGAGSPWHVHSALDGEHVARVPFVAGTTQATVLGTKAYGVASRSGRVLLEGKAGRRHELYAVDLESGKVLWRRPIKESGATPR